MLDNDIQEVILKLAQYYSEYKRVEESVLKNFWRKKIEKYEKILVNLTYNRYGGNYK